MVISDKLAKYLVERLFQELEQTRIAFEEVESRLLKSNDEKVMLEKELLEKVFESMKK
ncbi:MAG: hypothetical protein ACRC6E_09775 [Fusobacteriaceae bacterium]